VDYIFMPHIVLKNLQGFEMRIEFIKKRRKKEAF
jgi:hypothetical protein